MTDEQTTKQTTIDEELVPKARFKEVISRAQTAEAKLKELEAEREAQRMKDLEEQNRYKELNAELVQKNRELTELLDPLKQKADQYDSYTESRRALLLEKIPEDDRDIYEGIPLEKLEKAASRVTPPTAPSSTVNTSPQIRASNNGMKHPMDMTLEERKQNWDYVTKFYQNQRK